MSKDVFISYKSDEFDIACNIYQTLKNNGISVWMAPQDIPGGSSYAMEITNAIKGCKVFVLILSRAAQTSQWIPKEIDNAINEKKLILPFMVEKCELNAEFSFLLSNIQFKDAYTDRAKALEILIKEIKNFLGIREAPKPAAPASPKASGIPPEKIIEYVGKQLNGENPAIPEAADKKKAQPARKAYSPYEAGYDKKAGTEAPKPEKAAAARPSATAAAGSYTVRSKKKPALSRKKMLIVLAAAIILVLGAAIALSAGNGAFTPKVVIAGSEHKTDVSYLYLRDTVLTQDDIDNIGQLTALSSITIDNCEIQAQHFVQDVYYNFSSVTLTDSNITQQFYDSFSLENCQNLYFLDISGNPLITDLGLNEGSSKLSSLRIAGTGIDNIEAVYNRCTNITELDISGSAITDISFLSDNQKLERLGIAKLGLSSLDCISSMIFLTEIDISGNPVSSLSDLENCTLLQKVSFSDCDISDISVLAKSAEYLTEVRLASNSVSDLSPLSQCTKLTLVDITSNNVTSLEALKNSAEMRKLFASDNKITSVDGIEAFTKLNELDLSHNHIAKITTPLVFDSYASVYLNDNELTEVSLASESRYNQITLHNNSFTSASCLDGVYASKITFDYTDNFDTKVLSDNFLSVEIYGCPLDKQAELTNSVYGISFAE